MPGLGSDTTLYADTLLGDDGGWSLLHSVPTSLVTLLADLPHYYRGDRDAERFLIAVGNELERIEAFLDAFRFGYFPQNADDTYGLLGLWEASLGLPVMPPDATVLARRNQVMVALRKRKSGPSAKWMDNVTTALGSDQWTYAENTPDPYQLTITLPDAPGSYNVSLVRSLLRQITPAHLEMVTGYRTGFAVDVSTVDEESIE